MAARAKRRTKVSKRTSALKGTVEKARLAAVIMFTDRGLEVTFKGNWTGRDIQLVQAGLPQRYYAFQNQRLREARASEKATEPSGEDHA